MKIYTSEKKFFKETKEIQNAILSAIEDLYKRINLYESQNVSFDRIFNDDKVKYDKHGDFYTYKSKKNNLQLRILYSFFYIDDSPIFLIADYVVKKKNNKDYIKKFELINNKEVLGLYNYAKPVRI